MDYLDIKNSIASKQQQRNSLEYRIQLISRDLSDKSKAVNSLEDSYNRDLDLARSNAKDNFDDEITAPFYQAIAKLEDKKKQLISRHKKATDNNTLDKARKRFNNKTSTTVDAESLESFKSSVSSFYGDNMVNTLTAVLPNPVTSESDLSNLLSTYNNTIKLLKQKPFLDDLMIHSFENVKLTGEDKNALPLALFFIVLFVLSLYILYPLVIIILGFVLIYCLYKSYVFVKCMSVINGYNAHKKEVETLIDQRAGEMVKVRQETLDNKLQTALDKISRKISTLEKEMNDELIHQSNNFTFNDSELQGKYNANVDALNQEITNLQSDLTSAKDELAKVNAEIRRLNTDLDTSISNLSKEFLPDTLSESNELPSKYLYSLVDTEPVFLDLPRGTTLFLYSDKQISHSFQELFFLETIKRISLSMVTFHVFDIDNMAIHFAPYEFESCDWLNCYTNPDDVSMFIEILSNALKERRKTMATYDSIEAYNTELLEMDCPAEPYHFIFLNNPPASIITNTEFKQLMENGPRFGYYIYIFKDSQSLEDKNTAGPIINSCDLFYKISVDSIEKYAKDRLTMSL